MSMNSNYVFFSWSWNDGLSKVQETFPANCIVDAHCR